MDPKLERASYLVGEENLDYLARKKVMVCGVGGVGSFVAEALARSGVGGLVLVDSDVIDISNLNRQLMSSKENIGISKVEALRERLESISDCQVETLRTLINENFTVEGVDYVADCIDTLVGKMALVKECARRKIPIVSALGSAKRCRAENVTVTRLDRTRNDPLARNWRQLCRKEGFPPGDIRVVYCDTPPEKTSVKEKEGASRKERFPLGSLIFAVGSVGLKVAETVYMNLLENACPFPSENEL